MDEALVNAATDSTNAKVAAVKAKKAKKKRTLSAVPILPNKKHKTDTTRIEKLVTLLTTTCEGTGIIDPDTLKNLPAATWKMISTPDKNPKKIQKRAIDLDGKPFICALDQMEDGNVDLGYTGQRFNKKRVSVFVDTMGLQLLPGYHLDEGTFVMTAPYKREKPRRSTWHLGLVLEE